MYESKDNLILRYYNHVIMLLFHAKVKYIFGQFSRFIILENTRNLKLFWCLQGLQNGNTGQKWLKPKIKISKKINPTTLPLHRAFNSPLIVPTITHAIKTLGARYNKAGCPIFIKISATKVAANPRP